MKLKILAALGLCAFALNSLADPPSNTVNPRNAVLFNGYFVSNAVPAITNIPNSWTNIYLSAPYQHNISVTTLITGTNLQTHNPDAVWSTILYQANASNQWGLNFDRKSAVVKGCDNLSLAETKFRCGAR